MGNKKKKTFTQLVAVALSHFSNANFEKLKSFGWKTTGILQYLEVFTYSFEAEIHGDLFFFFFFRKKIK